MWLCCKGLRLVGIVRGLWQAGGEAARQAVRPSGGRGVCGAEGSALRITQIHSQIHTFYLAHRHTPTREHILTIKPTCFVNSLYSHLSP